jgi:hypothetical protein
LLFAVRRAWGSGRRAGWSSGWLVVAGRVECELADELAGSGVDDADVQVLDEHQDRVPAWVRPTPMWWSSR